MIWYNIMLYIYICVYSHMMYTYDVVLNSTDIYWYTYCDQVFESSCGDTTLKPLQQNRATETDQPDGKHHCTGSKVTSDDICLQQMWHDMMPVACPRVPAALLVSQSPLLRPFGRGLVRFCFLGSKLSTQQVPTDSNLNGWVRARNPKAFQGILSN